MRLDKFLANNNIGTRTEVKKYISKGRVKVNDSIVKKPDTFIDENSDIVYFDGNLIEYEKYYYIMLNKPEGYVCSAKEKGEKSVLSLINEAYSSKLFPVGRLDKDTTGLLLLTNDGPLCHNLLSPKKHVEKEYSIVSKNPVSDTMIEGFLEGIDIGDEKNTLPAKLYITGDSFNSNIVIKEGRYHQIKRMFETYDNEVVKLKRIRMKNLVLDDSLELGQYRALSQEELDDLKG